MLIGSHVSMSGKEMLLGSVKEALSYGANTFMFYTGAPQNTARKPIDQLRIEEAKELMKENGIEIDNVVVHAPYIICLLYKTDAADDGDRSNTISFTSRCPCRSWESDWFGKNR